MINSLIESDFLEMFIKPEYLLKSTILVVFDLTKVRNKNNVLNIFI